MMTRMTAVGPEAFTRRECISSGLSAVIRESRLQGGSTRRDRLLGVSPVNGSPSPLSMESGDELREEDVWGGGSEENLVLLEEYASAVQQQSSQEDPPPSRLRGRSQWFDTAVAGTSPLGLSAINRANKPAASTALKGSANATTRMVPQVAGYDPNRPASMMHQSAPVNIPDWSKILRSNDKENGGSGLGFGGGDGDLGGDDEGVFDMPPHELLAREYAKSHTVFSVHEGAGRTLKGRDLSRVRNAIWKQTGFLGG